MSCSLLSIREVRSKRRITSLLTPNIRRWPRSVSASIPLKIAILNRSASSAYTRSISGSTGKRRCSVKQIAPRPCPPAAANSRYFSGVTLESAERLVCTCRSTIIVMARLRFGESVANLDMIFEREDMRDQEDLRLHHDPISLGRHRTPQHYRVAIDLEMH